MSRGTESSTTSKLTGIRHVPACFKKCQILYMNEHSGAERPGRILTMMQGDEKVGDESVVLATQMKIKICFH